MGHGVALATAVAVSGTVVLLGLCRPWPVPSAVPAPRLVAVDGDSPTSPPCSLRSCISESTDTKKGTVRKTDKKKNKKKRVHFAEHVVELHVPAGCDAHNEEDDETVDDPEGAPSELPHLRRGVTKHEGMPANRVSLYKGILRDRHHRMACSY